MSGKIEILKESLKNKEDLLNKNIQNHFDTVAQANGQPLNDKRNGYKTLAKWEAQNDGIRKQMESIKKTKEAIEKEKLKIAVVDGFAIPAFLIPFLESREITQWRKYPNRFFVSDVEKGRIIWDEKKQKLSYSHLSEIPKDQVSKFKDVANKIFSKYKDFINESAH